jgi:hypothetical protein
VADILEKPCRADRRGGFLGWRTSPAARPAGADQGVDMASRIMRRILVDAARERTAAKRGGPAVNKVDPSSILDDIPAPECDRAADVCALDDALMTLGKVDPRARRWSNCVYVAG